MRAGFGLLDKHAQRQHTQMLIRQTGERRRAKPATSADLAAMGFKVVKKGKGDG